MSEPVQLGKAALADMTPEQIVAARKAGQLAELLRGGDPTGVPVRAPQLGKADIDRMSASEIVAARKAGQLNEYMATPRTDQRWTPRKDQR